MTEQALKHLRPIIVLADSQLLFYREDDVPYIRRIRALFDQHTTLSAAYIGASNGDKPEFYEMFQAAMESIDITDCKHITTALTPTQLHFLRNANIIMLSGGDIYQGWQTVRHLEPILRQARNNGAVLIGTSAGAIQLGQIGWHNKAYLSNTDLFATLGFIPAIFSAHEEQRDWPFLQQLISQTAGCLPGLGLPAGGGAIVTPDNQIQAIRRALAHAELDGEEVKLGSIWKLQL